MCKVVIEAFKDPQFVRTLLVCLGVFGGIAWYASIIGVI